MRLLSEDGVREKLIEKAGIETADSIEQLQKEINALHEYLNVVRVYGTIGWRLAESSIKKAV